MNMIIFLLFCALVCKLINNTHILVNKVKTIKEVPMLLFMVYF